MVAVLSLKRLRLSIVVALACFVPSLAMANPGPPALDGNSVTTALIGKTFIGVYDDGVPWRETYLVDGVADYQDPDHRSRGDWSVDDGRLCTFYQDSALTGGCFLVVRRSANCYDFYGIDPQTGDASADLRAMRAGYGWTARGWRSDQPKTCTDELVS